MPTTRQIFYSAIDLPYDTTNNNFSYLLFSFASFCLQEEGRHQQEQQNNQVTSTVK
jgi:hypothetical protein